MRYVQRMEEHEMELSKPTNEGRNEGQSGMRPTGGGRQNESGEYE
jgi:hypothetical protein